MRHTLVLLALLLPGSEAAADGVKIRDVRVGFVHVNEDFFKAGCWAPVTVEIENQIIGEQFEGSLTVESADSDGVMTRFSPRKVFIAKNEGTQTYLTYMKIGGSSAELRVTVRGAIGRGTYEHTFNYPADRQGAQRSSALNTDHRLILALGDPKGLEPPAEEEGNREWIIGRKWHTAFQTNVNLLPDKWFGYEGVDVVILPTGGTWRNSVAQLLANDPLKREALAQWVEMGGHLVVSASFNHSNVGSDNSFPLERLLPAEIDRSGTVKVERLEMVQNLVDSKIRPEFRYRKGQSVKPLAGEVARLTRRRSAQSLAEESNPKLPIVVQGSRGLGRVTLLAFDTEQGPFTIWENRRDFWPALLEIKPKREDPRTPGNWMPGRFGYEEYSTDVSGQLCTELEQFGEVRVIPFAWVALFIFVYILIVGPLDYLILKKVVKRLEWTWITFPIVVLGVSLGAYFLAHYLKGNELRINKVDAVEIDLHRQQASGTTWFTIFSPVLQHYDVGLEPVGFGKAAEGTVVSWMGRPGYGSRSLNRSQGPGLFYRSYEYENEGTAVKGVPVQVWSMKTLTGRWQASLDPQKPLFQYDLRSGNLRDVEGMVTSQLPYPLYHCQLIYRKSAYNLGTLEPGQAKKVPGDWTPVSSLWQSWGVTPFGSGRSRARQVSTTASPTGLVRQMMFFNEIRSNNQSGQESEYLNYLDQTWRLEMPEAMLIALLEEEDGSASELNDRERIGTKLTPFGPRLRGTLRQSTVVRVFMPVKAGP
jgi:hypothetical protein